MSSDSDIECDTENEEQEDAASAAEGFNHGFCVPSSSEGTSAGEPTLPSGPAKAEVAARALEVFVLKLKQALIRFGTPLLGSLLKPDRNGGNCF